ncbi:protein of unknown function DUF201 [Thermobaculum terrenum ATCC BAA-798]|uniref:ATP-grasp domain-containing protein n=1 Tax=Thermobaculum terrenum (strain ATCC BAA-798 / CCMEE 7001 / YNP1) TaxID=525904 RepID=D1CBA7_THET1|nr:ATP-grasp domain-containing protein [Thermobaculum terrenum]ACZ42072.1 protein of unknown function DUF201 [Thermobaculum terrenum ATCC BAA-798]
MDEKKISIILVYPSGSYRVLPYLKAAKSLDVKVLHVIDHMPPNINRQMPYDVVAVDFGKVEDAADSVVKAFAGKRPSAVIGIDDSSVVLASVIAQKMGLPGNTPQSVGISRDKSKLRETLTKAGLSNIRFYSSRLDADEHTLATRSFYPCVIKPVSLAASRGVIKANNPTEFIEAFSRIRNMLLEDGSDPSTQILVEEYVPGFEIAVDGLLTNGELTLIAIFDKPDPMEGPFFEETIYVTPSRLSPNIQGRVVNLIQLASKAIGLKHGPIHAELRVNDDSIHLIEIAARAIGGKCSTILEYKLGMSLEELIIRHSLGNTASINWLTIKDNNIATGVMMIPIPRSGILNKVSGMEEALSIEGIENIDINIPLKSHVTPLPEGATYLGFIFAKGPTPEKVEYSLRKAHSLLKIEITPEIPIINRHFHLKSEEGLTSNVH